MKKTIVIILIILCISSIIAYFSIKNMQLEKEKVQKFNSEYEYYNDKNLNGLDITTLINKATSNNEKYQIPKDEEGLYVLDDKYSIEIYVTMIINNTTYRMERISNLGITSFVEYFGSVKFKCTKVEYHKDTGRIASMVFEAMEY